MPVTADRNLEDDQIVDLKYFIHTLQVPPREGGLRGFFSWAGCYTEDLLTPEMVEATFRSSWKDCPYSLVQQIRQGEFTSQRL